MKRKYYLSVHLTAHELLPLYVASILSSILNLLHHRSPADCSKSMLLFIILAISAFYYFMRKMRRDENDDDDGTALLPGSRFDNWELAFE